MLKTSAVLTAAVRLASVVMAVTVLFGGPAQADWKQPWKSSDKALVVDAYEFNPIDWNKLSADKRIAGFINKASDGLPPDWNCGRDTGDEYKLCKNRWWKYSVTKELYMTRRQMAKMKGLLWGAYHLGRPGNPREQADHFVDFSEPQDDDLIALDIEDRTDDWMSLSDAEIFADQVKIRTGRYPVLYTNGSTAKYISQHKADYPLLSRLPLWYARYRDDISGKFPEETWPTYALWQFSSMHNCNSSRCPYRVDGTKFDIDVNVSTMDVADLKKAWPFKDLIDSAPQVDDAGVAIASVSDATKAEVAEVAATLSSRKISAEEVPGTLAAAYGPSERTHAIIDPLRLLTDVARHEHEDAAGENGRQAVDVAQDKPQSHAVSSSPASGMAATTLAAVPALSEENMDKLQDKLWSLKKSVAVAANELDRFLVGPAEASELSLEEGASIENDGMTGRSKVLGPIDHTRFVSMLKAAEDERKAAQLPSRANSGAIMRGPRLMEASLRASDLALSDRRITAAFATTR